MTALVTGSANGIGRQYAEQLADRGYNLILVDKDENINSVAEEIMASHPELTARSILFDLARESAAEELFADVQSRGERVDLLINDAGEFSFRDICKVDDEVIRSIITLHDLTLTRMNRIFGNEMVKNGGGYILNMSSYSIWMPLPGLALYSASKAYVKAFSVAFSKEVRENKVYVTAICPAGVATDLYGLSKEFQKKGVKSGTLITPERCAKRALKALFRHKRYSVPDWWNCLFIPILMHLPTWLENIIRRETMKFQK